jgi:uncharacterized membrane protein
MEAPHLTALLLALLACSVKFAIAYPSAIVGFGFSFPEAVLFGVAGGGLGVLAFTYAGQAIVRMCDGLMLRVRRKKKDRPKRIFTPGRRRLVRIRRRYGLWGIALLSPVLISIPIGCLVAVRFYSDRGRILRTMMAAVVFWSVLMAAFRDAFLQIVQALSG